MSQDRPKLHGSSGDSLRMPKEYSIQGGLSNELSCGCSLNAQLIVEPGPAKSTKEAARLDRIRCHGYERGPERARKLYPQGLAKAV